jgi:hypothetical protein
MKRLGVSKHGRGFWVGVHLRRGVDRCFCTAVSLINCFLVDEDSLVDGKERDS